MTDYKEDPNTGIAEIVVDEKITKDDFDRISKQLEAFIQSQGKVKFLEEIRNFEGFDPTVAFKGLRFDIQHMKDISHCAVVTDMGWVGPFASAAGHLVSCEIRVFQGNEIEDARAWLREA